MNGLARKLKALATFFAVALLGTASLSHAQAYSTCKSFSQNPHDALDCIEAMFSASPAHLTFSSMPPGNGLALGGVLEQNTHYVSAFATPTNPELLSGRAGPVLPTGSTSSLPSFAYLWSADARLAALYSMNGSWVATGSLTLMPKGYVPGHRTDHNGVEVSCNKLGSLCTRKVFGLHLEGTHRSLQTLSFYGLGPLSPPVKYFFKENDTFGSVRAALPVRDWLTLETGFEYRQTDLPAATAANSATEFFSEFAAPGISQQPAVAHPHVAIKTAPILYVSPRTDDSDLNHSGPLMKPYLLFTLRNSFEYHWYSATSDHIYSFEQAVFDADENIQLDAIVRRYVQVADVKGGLSHLLNATLARSCGDKGVDWSKPERYVLKVHQPCRFGNVDLRSHVVASRTSSNSVVPFYLQPTVGGSDIDSRPSLRAYPDYRFRDRDAMFVQADYSVPVIDPLGFLLFYDAGTVSPTFSGLSFGHLRQDGGVGVTVSVQGHVAGQGYLAFGAGHGPTLAYNFTKFF